MTRLQGRAVPVSLLGLVAVASIGCGAFGYPTGSVYTGTTVPHGMSLLEGSGPGKADTKQGEACATGILGIAAWGDASLDAAKKAGGITDVHSVEFRGLNILGIYTQGCTVAHGGGAGDMPPAVAGGGGGGGTAWGAGDGGGSGGPGTPGTMNGGSGNLKGGPTAGGPGGGQVLGAGGDPGANGLLKSVGADGVLSVANGVPQIPGPPDPKTPLVKFAADMRATRHTCVAYDPADAPAGQQPWPVYKKDYAPPNSAGFVDRCPTENLVATCDFRKHTQSPMPNDFIEFFYAGMDEGTMAAQEPVCTNVWHGTWKWLVAPAAAAKLPPEPPVALACDTRKAVATCTGPCQPGCTAWKTSGPSLNGQPLVPDLKALFAQQKQACTGVVVDRCPAVGLTGRCESSLQGTIMYTYSTDRGTQQMAQSVCKQTGGTWTAP
jgi:hypothetical protein